MSANSARILQKAALTFDKTAVLPLDVGKAKQPGVIPQHPRDQPLGSEGSRFACLNRGPSELLLHRRVNQASFPVQAQSAVARCGSGLPKASRSNRHQM